MLPRFVYDSPDLMIGDLVSGPSGLAFFNGLIKKNPRATDEFFREKCRDLGFPLYVVSNIATTGWLRRERYIEIKRLRDGETFRVYPKRPLNGGWFPLREIQRYCLETKSAQAA